MNLLLNHRIKIHLSHSKKNNRYMTKIDLNTERMSGYGDYEREGHKVNRLFGLDDFCKKYITKETKVLELGCNDGVSTRLFCYYSNNVIGVDLTKTQKITDLINSTDNFLFYNTSFSEFFKKNTELFDVIYIDGAHDFNSVINDIKGSLLTIKSGGILAGHDFYETTGVPKAVHHTFKNVDIEVFSDSTWAIKLN